MNRRFAVLVPTAAICLCAVCHPAALVVNKVADSGAGSLRDALTQSNANGEADTIVFALGLAGKTIQPATALPAPTEGNTTIKGDRTTAGKPDVIVDGSKCGGTCIDIQSANNTIRGLCITGFATGVAITGAAATGNSVFGCHIGTDLAGTQAQPNQTGVHISGGASSNTVGGTSDQRRNVISGNSTAGVLIAGGDGNAILGNYIGTSADGMSGIGNANGIVVRDGATNTQIGSANPNSGNLISASTDAGIRVAGATTTGTKIVRNGIGANAQQVVSLGNHGAAVEVSGGGSVVIGQSGQGNVIGVPAQGTGILIASGDASGTRIEDNGITTHVYEARQGNWGIKIDLRYSTGRFVGRIADNEFFKQQESILLMGAEVKPVVAGNSFRWCRDGVNITDGANPNLGNLADANANNDGGNKFWGDIVATVKNETSNAIKAEGNDWGATSRSDIDARITDQKDNRSYGRVDYDPLIGGASPTP